MKELSIEDKAKRYDEAIEELRGLLEGIHEDKCNIMEEDIIKIFPELKESEDERVRKTLLYYHKNAPEQYTCGGLTNAEVVAWLEKQGEQKPLVIPKFREGDIIKRKDTSETFEVSKIEAIYADEIYYHLTNGGCVCENSDNFERVEQKSAWSEEDEKFIHGLIRGLAAKRDIHGHITFSSDGIDITKTIDWLKSLKDRVQPQPKQEWKQENTGDLNDFENAMMHIANSFFGQYAGLDPNDTNAIKEQANLLLELVPNKEWSEEDKYYQNIILYCLSNECVGKTDKENAIIWLKSLRPQNTWKPSKEQIIALRWVLNNVPYNKHKEEISGLLDQIKDL